MKLSRILSELEAIAPLHLAEGWDQVGLHVGDPGRSVSRALLCIDLTEAVLEEAVRQKAQLIVAYHPPIFKALSRLTTGDLKQRIILRAAEKRIAIYSPHTALDEAERGVNDWLAAGLGKGLIETIKPSGPVGGAGFKLVTFVPAESVDAVRAAMSGAGAGRIGNYESCSFKAGGEGTFKGGASSSPAIGRAGRFERVSEERLEVPLGRGRLHEVVSALRSAHPYEEPAFDVYPLEPVSDARAGQGRVVTLDKPVSLTVLAKRIKALLGVNHLEVGSPRGLKQVRRVGLCAGAGISLLPDAGPIDAFFTGEMRHHDQLEAIGKGVAVLLAGHTQTERPYLPTYKKLLSKRTGKAVAWAVSKADRAPTMIR